MTPNPLLSCDEDGDGDDDNKGGFFSFPQTPGREGRHGKWNTHCVLSSLMELAVASESLEPGGWPHSLPGTGRGFGAPPGEFGGNPGDRWREAVCSTTGPFSAPPSSVTRKMLGISGRLAEPSAAAGPTGLPSWTGSESSGDGECGHRSQKQRRRGRHRLHTPPRNWKKSWGGLRPPTGQRPQQGVESKLSRGTGSDIPMCPGHSFTISYGPATGRAAEGAGAEGQNTWLKSWHLSLSAV